MPRPTSALAALPAITVLGCGLVVAGCAGATTSTDSTTSTGPTVSAAASTGAAVTSASVPSTAASSQHAVPAESAPPGEIPDNVAFVTYRSAAGRYSFRHPEGWLQSTEGNAVLFSDKLNGVRVEPGTGSTVPTVAAAEASDLPALARTQPAFAPRHVDAVTEPAGRGVRIVYRRNSVPNAVTGRQYRDEVERYELAANGRSIVVELFGPVGADNVDAYRTMIQSLRLS